MKVLKAISNIEWYREVRAAALKHDGIPLDAAFVVLSEDNPYRPEFDRAALAVTTNPHGLCAVVI